MYNERDVRGDAGPSARAQAERAAALDAARRRPSAQGPGPEFAGGAKDGKAVVVGDGGAGYERQDSASRRTPMRESYSVNTTPCTPNRGTPNQNPLAPKPLDSETPRLRNP